MQIGPPTTLGNMRSLGVRSLAVWCLGPGSHHQRTLDVSSYPDDASVRSFGRKLRVGAYIGGGGRNV